MSNMPITALNPDTVRLLGSPTVITTPVDLVKELLDNAIDAKATSVEVIVSQNLIDAIEVRDNGHGIHPDDYESLGRPGYTSKITSFEDLQVLGGTTLGFRGQALASANGLGLVVVTTRTAEDVTALELSLTPGVGGVESRRRVSAPTGTAVRVTGLFRNLPVRKQVAEREAQRNTMSTRHLLHSYALARPEIRLSFKTRGGNGKQGCTWSYAPRPDATVKEAVIQVLGADVMSQCLIRTICSSTEEEGNPNGQGTDRLTIEAVLPRPDADQSRISKGAFFSVDSRPMSIRRGTMKKIFTAFKTHLSKKLEISSGNTSSKDPFIGVNIKCSPGMYDPNIEPSKNEVLFGNESRLIDLFDSLCSEVYKLGESPETPVTIETRQILLRTQTHTPPLSSDGPQEDSDSMKGVQVRDSCEKTPRRRQTPFRKTPSPALGNLVGAVLHRPSRSTDISNDAEVQQVSNTEVSPFSTLDMEAQTTNKTSKPGHTISNQDESLAHVDHGRRAEKDLPRPDCTLNRGVRSRRRIFDTPAPTDISSDEEADMLASRFRGQPEEDPRLDEPCEDPKAGLNPWTIAKLAAPARQPTDQTVQEMHAPHDRRHSREPRIFSIPDEAMEEDLSILRPYGGPPGDLDPPRNTSLGTSHTRYQQQQMPNFQNSSLLGDSISSSNDRNIPSRQHFETEGDRSTLLSMTQHHEDGDSITGMNGFARTTLPFEGPRPSQRNRRGQYKQHIDQIPSRNSYNPPFRKPRRVNGGNKVPHITGDTRNINGQATGRGDNHRLDEYLGGYMRQEKLPRPSRAPSPANGSMDDRVVQRPISSAPSALNTDDASFEEDSRKYLMRRQRSEAEDRRRGRPTLKRTRTDRLPLETVPHIQEMQHLTLALVPDIEKLRRVFGTSFEDDVAFSDICADVRLSDQIGLDDAVDIEAKLKSTLDLWAEKTLGKKIEVSVDIRSLVKGKAVAA